MWAFCAVLLRTSCVCRAVGLLQQYITLTLYHQQLLTAGVQAATKLLGLIHEANQVRLGGWVSGRGVQ